MALSISLAAVGTAMAEEGGDTVFVPGTSVNGLGIADLTVDEAAERIGSFYTRDYTLTIKERGGKTETITGDQIGFSVKLPDGFLQEKLNQQNAAGRVFGPDVDNKYKTDMISSFQKEQLEQAIGALDCITGNGMTAAADARISDYAEGEAFTVIPEIRGNQTDPEKTAEVIRCADRAYGGGSGGLRLLHRAEDILRGRDIKSTVRYDEPVQENGDYLYDR